jgi:hypothetical protein
MTATMKTTPATMPTQAATVVSRRRRGGSVYTGAAGGGVEVATGPVAGSGDSEDDVVSLMNPSMRAMSVCLS